MTYEKPEALEVGSAQEVILGQKAGFPLESDGRQKVVNPITDFETPEALEVGSAQEVILGQKAGFPLESDGRQKVVNPITDFEE
jgi:hypothetical protein